MNDSPQTLPDYLSQGLALVFVGLNPSLYSVKTGHYFANPRNRFWTALNLSGLVGVELSAEVDHTLPDHGIGLTDVVKRPTAGASGLTSQDFRTWAPVLKEKLERFRPRLVCFHGLTGYRQYLRYGEGSRAPASLGLQEHQIGGVPVYVTPNPSPANARYSLDDLAGWYRELGKLMGRIEGPGPRL